MDEDDRDVTDDTLLAGRIRLRQPRRGHRVGTDAVLLAATVAPAEKEVVYDIGSGVGAVGLMIAIRSNASIVFLERDPRLAALCRENIALNQLAHRASVVVADVLARARGRRELLESADTVVTNPPFLDEMRSRRSPSHERASAHHLPRGGLSRWISSCAGLLKPRGRLAIIHRAERLDECLKHLGSGFGAIALRAVHPRSDEDAIRILITAVKGSRAPLKLLPPMVLHEPGGAFTSEAAAIHAGERLLLSE